MKTGSTTGRARPVLCGWRERAGPLGRAAAPQEGGRKPGRFAALVLEGDGEPGRFAAMAMDGGRNPSRSSSGTIY